MKVLLDCNLKLFIMKMKKVIIGLIVSLFLLSLLSSCAIDRKCPAYSRLTDSAFFIHPNANV